MPEEENIPAEENQPQEESPQEAAEATPVETLEEIQEAEVTESEQAPPEEGKKAPEVKAAQKSISSRYGVNRAMVRSDSGASRKMAWIILLETVFILVVTGLCVYLIYQRYQINQKIGTDSGELAKARDEAQQAKKQVEELTTKKTDLENELMQAKATAEGLASDVQRISGEKDKLLTKIDPLEGQIKTLQQDLEAANQKAIDNENALKPLKEANEQLREDLTNKNDEINGLKEKHGSLEKQIDGLQAQLKEERAKNLTRTVDRTEFLSQHNKYVPKAQVVIDALKEIQKKLQDGMTVREFVRELDVIDIDELRNDTSAYSKFLSFQLIITAFNSYQESADRWTKLSKQPKTSLPKELYDLMNKTLNTKLAREYRPWFDIIQLNWYTAQSCLLTAEWLLKNQDDFNPTKCSVCEGKHFVICSKCNGSGECFECGGKGKGGDELICPVCTGSGRCVLCGGKKESVPCPVCVSTLKVPDKGK